MSEQRIVLDTNCLLQIIPKRSRYRKVWDCITEGKVALCVTTDILLEYEEVLSRNTSEQVAKNIVDAISGNDSTIKIGTYEEYWLIQADPDDNKFVDCAIAAEARYIVTDDAHFNVLGTIKRPHVDVSHLDDYLSELESLYNI